MITYYYFYYYYYYYYYYLGRIGADYYPGKIVSVMSGRDVTVLFDHSGEGIVYSNLLYPTNTPNIISDSIPQTVQVQLYSK